IDKNLKVKEVKNEYTRLYATLTYEQALKVQESVDETFKNRTFNERQIFEVLKSF
ncbi:18713_t:CDS:1, partial [Gigaspora margarita]